MCSTDTHSPHSSPGWVVTLTIALLGHAHNPWDQNPAFLNHPHIHRYRSLCSGSAISQEVTVTQNIALLHYLTVGTLSQSHVHCSSSIMGVTLTHNY